LIISFILRGVVEHFAVEKDIFQELEKVFRGLPLELEELAFTIIIFSFSPAKHPVNGSHSVFNVSTKENQTCSEKNEICVEENVHDDLLLVAYYCSSGA